VTTFLKQWLGRGVYAIHAQLLLPNGSIVTLETDLGKADGELVYSKLRGALLRQRADPPPPVLPARKNNVIPLPVAYKHPDCELKLKDYVGKRVRALRTFNLRLGGRIKAGEILEVSGVWRGTLSLTHPTRGTTPITRVARGDVEVVRDEERRT
jgi:hypothetical protein